MVSGEPERRIDQLGIGCEQRVATPLSDESAQLDGLIALALPGSKTICDLMKGQVQGRDRTRRVDDKGSSGVGVSIRADLCCDPNARIEKEHG